MAKIHYAQVNENNEVVLPPHFVKELGIAVGDEIRIEKNGHGVYLRPSIHTLKGVYIEVTNKCNLSSACLRRCLWAQGLIRCP